MSRAMDAATWALRMSEYIKHEEVLLRRYCYGTFEDATGMREITRMGDELLDRKVPVLPDTIAYAMNGRSGLPDDIRRNLGYWADDMLQRRLWARTRTVYAVDPELWRILGEVEDDDVLHADTFNYLPHPNPFFYFPEPIITETDVAGEVQHMVGMLVTGRSGNIKVGIIGDLRVSTDDPRSVGLGLLFFGPVYRDGVMQKLPGGHPDAVINRVGIAFNGEETCTFGQLMENVRGRFTGAATAHSGGDFVAQMDIALRRALSVLTYVCATNAEVDKAPAVAGNRAVRVVTGEGARTPKAPKVFDVGIRVGVSLKAARLARSGGTGQLTGRKMAPHVRRAHPHTYWCGPGRQERRIKWLFPILVNAHGQDMAVTTVHPVKV